MNGYYSTIRIIYINFRNNIFDTPSQSLLTIFYSKIPRCFEEYIQKWILFLLYIFFPFNKLFRRCRLRDICYLLLPVEADSFWCCQLVLLLALIPLLILNNNDTLAYISVHLSGSPAMGNGTLREMVCCGFSELKTWKIETRFNLGSDWRSDVQGEACET